MEMVSMKNQLELEKARATARGETRTRGGRRSILPGVALAAILCLLSFGALFANQTAGGTDTTTTSTPATLDETRLTMDKWIETQQIISKEGKEWREGKEILLGRLDLVKNEVAALEEKIKKAESDVAEAAKKRDELQAENEQLKSMGTRLNEGVTVLEGQVRKLVKLLPEANQTKLQPITQRMPEDPTTTKVTAAERFQNVLLILKELNKTNNDITVSYEVRTLADGRRAEVQAIYVGLAQAYYVSANGEAGIGHPTAEGWTWEPSKAVSGDVMKTLEIMQGKHTPDFVALPVKIK
jgi:hypothetical protein